MIKEFLLRTDASIDQHPVLLTAPTGQHCLLLLWQHITGIAVVCYFMKASIFQ